MALRMPCRSRRPLLCKKDTYSVIAKELFEKDATYSSAYASQPDKFASAVQSCLSTCWCEAWQPSISKSKVPFDSAPSTDQTSDFLSMIHCGAATIPSQCPTAQDICNRQDAPEVQDLMNEDIRADTNMLDDGGEPADAEGHQSISWDIDPETGDILYCDRDVMMEDGEEGPVNEFDFQAEQEEGGREYEPEGAWTQMPVDADPPPAVSIWMKNDLREHLDNFDAGSQDQKLSSGVLRNKWYSMKMQAWMWDKDITFLETQQVTKHAEAEAIHQRQLEVKKTNLKLWKANAEVLDKQSQVFMLQLCLAEFKKKSNHGHGTNPSSSGTDAGLGSGYA
ncbi:hypothetical protein BDN67DRAFT_983857 [Paxillus ammoniavirescens]|nr:hypothetical protein BDN67DRAFT_983857 [Paxillus ammoniavirescens]